MSFFPAEILLAIDGSEEATLATEAATELSKNTASEMHLAYVLPTPERLAYPHHNSTEVREDILEHAKKEAGEFLDKQGEQIRSGVGSVTEAHRRTGSQRRHGPTLLQGAVCATSGRKARIL